MKKVRNNFIITAILLLIFIIFTVLVAKVDVKAIGPQSSSVGFATLNKFFADKIGYNPLFLKMTDVAGYIAFAIMGVFGIVGLCQLINRKKLLKVDHDILCLGGVFVLCAVIYAAFEKIIINYRPVILASQLEASYPSSHTMFAIFILISAVITINRMYYYNKKLLFVIDFALLALCVFIVVGRIISGVHWISDIIGGCLIAAFLVMTHYSFIKLFDEIKEKRYMEGNF